MRTRKLAGAALTALVLAIAAGCGGGGSDSSSDVLRIGTVNYIDSLNPFNYIEAQATNAMIMIYPQLVQYGPGMKFEGDWASSWRRPPTARTGRSRCARTRSGPTASR